MTDTYKQVPGRSLDELKAYELGCADKIKGYKNENPYLYGERKYYEYQRGYTLATTVRRDND